MNSNGRVTHGVPLESNEEEEEGEANSGNRHIKADRSPSTEELRLIAHSGSFPWWHPTRRPYRFTIMLLACLMCTGVYMSYDSIGAISPYLKGGMTLDESEYSRLVAVYALPNVVLAFLGGILTDKIGYNKASMLFSTFVVIGNTIIAAAENYYGMLIGRFVFGLGGESLIVAQTTILTHWFAEKDLGIAFGFSLSFGYLGSFAALWTLPHIAENISYTTAFWFSAGVCIISMLFNIVLVILDANAQRILTRDGLTKSGQAIDETATQKPSIRDVLKLPKTYWLVVLISLCFYAAMTFPTYCTDYLYNKFDYDENSAARTTSIIYFAAMILSPGVGWISDTLGYRVQLMAIGLASMVPAFFLLAWTTFNPFVTVVALGLAYAIVPSILWTTIPILVEESLVGKAFGLSYSLYDGIIFIVPLIYGHLHDSTGEATWGISFYGFLSGVGVLACYPLYMYNKKFGGNSLQKPTSQLLASK